MHDIAINWLALIVAALARMILGAVWYSPAVLLKPWLAAAGITEAQMKTRFPKALVADVVGSLLMAFALAHLVKFAGAESVGYGAGFGFLTWLSFIAVTTFSATLYEHRPIKLWLIGNSYHAIALMIMGAILAAWP
ncbi:MAG TPA: DUF1761 domain-containing protein [Stellaceae bacterium]|nr:DUF1761 domain-containing protein [Stellaceae bacterium]